MGQRMSRHPHHRAHCNTGKERAGKLSSDQRKPSPTPQASTSPMENDFQDFQDSQRTCWSTHCLTSMATGVSKVLLYRIVSSPHQTNHVAIISPSTICRGCNPSLEKSEVTVHRRACQDQNSRPLSSKSLVLPMALS